MGTGVTNWIIERIKTKRRPDPPEVNATSALSITADGRVTYSKDPDTVYVPASITKLLVLHLARQTITDDRLEETVTFTEGDRLGGTSADLVPGDVITWGDLFHGLVLPSGNDAAKCIARNLGRHYSGTGGPIRRFITAMNDYATEHFGWYGAHFATASGRGQKSRMTARQACELVLALDPYSVKVAGAATHDITVEGPNARTYTVKHTVDSQSPVPLPEKIAAKTGTIGQAEVANCVTLWEDSRGERHATAVLGSWPGRERYRDTRALIDYSKAVL